MRLHASCVTYDRRGVLILGQSGAGKSSLALQLMAFGARLVSDDQTLIDLRDGWPNAQAVDALHCMIEARGIGLLRADPSVRARVELVVDLDQLEQDRLPADRSFDLLGQPVQLFHKVESPHFVAGILQYLKGGKVNLE